MNNITCICLGVKDMERSIKFYRDGLGYKTDCRENSPSVCFFDLLFCKLFNKFTCQFVHLIYFFAF